MSFVLFGVVAGAIWGPLVFGPMFSNRSLDARDLVLPWVAAALFTLVGLLVSLGVRPDPRELSREFATPGADDEEAAPFRELIRRPGVATAVVAGVTSFALMAGVMNLAGYVAVGHGHSHGSIFTVISIHILGMYGLILVIGDLVDRIGRRRSMVIGLTVIAFSNAGLAFFASIAGMSLCLFGLGLGWSLSYVAATTELVNLASPAERGRLVGTSDLLASGAAAALALGGGVLYTGAGGAVSLAAAAAGLAFLSAAWVAGSDATLLPSAPADA
jgi:predicted MFS family arabinose efflux permease